MKTLSPADFKTMPWVNGLGSTTEIFKQPSPTTNKFLWRVSLANVPTSGPFSVFDGYERIIAVASGGGMTLRVAGCDPATLRSGDDAYRFSGAAATDCELLAGPIRDFNLIFDPGFIRGDVVVLSASGRRTFESARGQTTLVYVFEGSVEMSGDVLAAGFAGMVEGDVVGIELRDGLAFVVAVEGV
jgi:uncharacterized protein